RGAPIFILPLLIVLSVAATLPDGPFHFVDSSTEAGMTTPIVYGNGKTQRYILETTGTGVAIFDFDNDGRPDVFLVNGSDQIPPSSDSATSRLYRNLGEGRFEEAASRLAHSGGGQAA